MNLLDIFFPKKCIGCKKFSEYLCSDCFAKLSFVVVPKCLICNRQSFDGMTHPKCMGKYAIDGCFAALAYKGILRKLLYQFKYNPYLSDLKHVLGDLLYEQLIQDELFYKIVEQKPTLISIPISKVKLRKRGYNHAEILAKNLGKKLNLQVQTILKRVKETKPQYGLKREERVENIRGAFGVVRSSSFVVGSKTVLLVDDIVTTGATLREAASVLKKNGFKKVYGLVLAQD